MKVSLEQLLKKTTFLLSALFFFFLFFNFLNRSVWGYHEAPTTYSCSSEYKLFGTYCCKKTYQLNSNKCYDKVNGLQVAIAMNYTQPVTATPQGTRIRFSTETVCTYFASPLIHATNCSSNPTPDPGPGGQEEIWGDSIASDSTLQATPTPGTCASDECTDTITFNGPPPYDSTYCFDEGEKEPNVFSTPSAGSGTHPNEWCCYALNNPTVLGWHANYSECEAPPPDDDDGDDDGTPGEAPKALTCVEACADEEGEMYTKCTQCCYGGTGSGGGGEFSNTWTEVGCIRADQAGVIKSVMRIFFGIVTGIAILRFVQAAMLLNSDDPEKIKEGKGVAVSAVAALLFGAMLPILLNFIGFDILGIGNIVNIG